MHESLIENIKINIEETQVETHSNLVKGWILSLDKTIEIMLVHPEGFKEALKISNFLSREDVSAFYNTENTGLEFNFKLDRATKYNYYIKYKDEDEIIKIYETTYDLPSNFNLLNSGFNENKKTVIVVDNFYQQPDLIREYVISNFSFEASGYHKGQRSNEKMILNGTKEVFESILNKKIINWDEYGYNGVFQFCVAEDPLVYHYDKQKYAAVVYLTPNAPPETGTSLFRSNANGKYRFEENEMGTEIDFASFEGNFYDKTKHTKIDTIGNVYNRLVIWDARTIHAANEYFGSDINNSRFFHMFFFDVE